MCLCVCVCVCVFLSVRLFPTEFVLKPVDTVIDVEDDLLWDCTATGQPEPTITWKKDGYELGPGLPSHIQILTNNSLKITAVKPGDEGQYQCFARSGQARHVVQALLTVRSKMVVLLPLYVIL